MTSLTAADRATISVARQRLAGRLLCVLEANHGRALAALVVLSLACLAPGFVSLQPMDRDEPRFAQASKQMLETGDFVDIRFQDEARHKKPVGIYWLQSAAVAAGEASGIPDARTTIALYRLPSLLGALVTVLLTYWAALAFVTRRGAFLAAAFVAASILLTVEARLAKTDAVLAACCVAALGGLARAYLRRGTTRLPLPAVLAFWSAVALGILIKGPMVLLFAGLPAAALSVRERSARWLRSLRPGTGALVTLAIVAPWFVAIALRSSGTFFAEAVGHDMLGKVGAAQSYHWAPPGFYALAFFATFWPAAILAVIAAPFAWANRREDGLAFLLAWILPAWLVLEIVPTKLPHYVLPLYPAVAIATVIAIERGAVGPWRPGATLAALAQPLVPVGLTVALLAGFWMLDRSLPFAGLPVLLAACLASILAWRAFAGGAVEGSALLGIAAAVLLSLGVFGLAQPDWRGLQVSPRLAAIARDLPCDAPRVATLGYREPSLVFLLGTDLAMPEGGAETADFLGVGGCRLAFVERRREPDFQAAITRTGLSPTLLTRVEGFNINGGRRLDIGAYSVQP
jgi:4-amino-4-deoxy-L-arabinose transferase-like glycosyltransferase